MITIVGFGNELRGEDAFGVNVISELQKLKLQNLKLISCFQLTPELTLELKDSSKIIFIDAAYSVEEQYKLACNLQNNISNSLTHHISIDTLIYMLKQLYNKSPNFEIFSMLTSSFDKIRDEEKYLKCIKETIEAINS